MDKKTTTDTIINKLDPNKFRCKICLRYRDVSQRVLVKEMSLCSICHNEWNTYCYKTKHNCVGSCGSCRKQWKKKRKLKGY